MSDARPVQPPIEPLAIVRQGLASTWSGFDALLRIGWLPALVLTLAGALLEPDQIRFNAEGMIEVTGDVMAIIVALAILASLMHAMVAAAWQRCLLMPGADLPRRWHLRLGGRELVYALVAFFLLGLLSMGVATAPGAVQAFAMGQPAGGLLMMAGPFVAIVVVARTVMVLPAIALDRGADMGKSWRGAQGNTLRIAITLFLVALPAVAGQLVLLEMSAAVVAGQLGIVVELVLRFVLALLSFALIAPIVAVTGMLYALLVDAALQGMLPRPAASYLRPRD